MRHLTFIFTGVLMAALFGPAPTSRAGEKTPIPAPSRQVSVPEASVPDGARIVRLSNGLTVLILKDTRFPLVATRLYVHAGSAYEKPDQAGISHLLEHMVFKGTERRPKGAVSKEVEAAGGYLNAATSFDYTVYITDMPSRHWKLGMDVVRDMAFHATLDPQELEAEKNVVVSELQRGLDNPGNRLFTALQAAALKGTPYERPIIGYEQTIRSITAQNIRDYIRTYYQPRNMLLTVVGNVEPDAVLAEAEAAFSGYRNDAPLPVPQPFDALKLPITPVVTVEPGPWNKVYLAAAVPVPGNGDYQSATLDVLAHLLGGDRTSLFYRTYKYEKQLVDNISVSNAGFERIGMLMITAELAADKVETFWKALTADLANLTASRFSEAEIARAKLNLEDSLFRAKETLPGLASKMGYFQFFLGGEQGEINAVEALQAVNSALLQRALDTWLEPGRLVTAALPPKSATLPNLALIREQNWPVEAGTAAAEAAKQNKTEIVDLGGGRTVVLIPDRTLPYVSLDLVFSGGDALLEPAEQGLASLTARTLTKGTTKRDEAAVQRFLADRAASLSAAAGKQSFRIHLENPARFNNDLFSLLAETVTSPAFRPEETEREKQSQIASIRSIEDQPLGLAFRKLPPFLFPHSVYGYEQLGQIAGVEAMTAAEVAAFWKKQIARPWVLAAVGDFDREKVLLLARSLPVPQSAEVKLPTPSWGKDKTLDLTLPDRTQAHLMLIFKTVPLGDKTAPVFDLLEAVLGGMGGPLFHDLRDVQALGYTVTTFNRQSEETGYMVFYIGTEPAKLQQAEAGFKKVIAGLSRDLMPVKELKRGLNQLEGEYYRGRQSLADRSSEAAGLTLLGKPLDFTRDQIEKARNVTPEDIREAARAYLREEDAYIVKVLP